MLPYSPGHQPDSQRYQPGDEQEVVDQAKHWNEVGDEVQGAESVGQGGCCDDFGEASQLRVARCIVQRCDRPFERLDLSSEVGPPSCRSLTLSRCISARPCTPRASFASLLEGPPSGIWPLGTAHQSTATPSAGHDCKRLHPGLGLSA